MKPKCDPAIHGDDWVGHTVSRKHRRPKSESPKIKVKIRLDAKTVEHLRSSGSGWQTPVNALLSRLVAAGRL